MCVEIQSRIRNSIHMIENTAIQLKQFEEEGYAVISLDGSDELISAINTDVDQY